MKWLRDWITALSMAFGMFCAIPCPIKRWDENLRARQLVCLPLVGAFIGLLWGAAALLLCGWCGWSGLLPAALLTALPLLLTGFIHLDGFMDCCDAIYSRRDLEKRQQILKDSHCGAFAVIHLALYLMLFVGAMDHAAAVPVALVFLPMATRCVAGLSVATIRPMHTSQYAAVRRYRPRHIVALGVLLAVSVAVPVLLEGLCGLSAAAAALAAFCTVRFGVKQLDGMSGDISGFAITRGEVAGVLALAVLNWLGGVL